MWTATQPARFLDLVANDALYAIGRLIALRGLRRNDGGSASGVHPGIQSRSPTLHFAVASEVTGLPDLESIDEVPAADDESESIRLTESLTVSGASSRCRYSKEERPLADWQHTHIALPIRAPGITGA